MGSLGATEIVLIVLVFVLLFGAKKIPELMRGLGSGLKEFKKAANEISDENESKSENKQ
jgi:sec-independent protein translocase protein TatA